MGCLGLGSVISHIWRKSAPDMGYPALWRLNTRSEIALEALSNQTSPLKNPIFLFA